MKIRQAIYADCADLAQIQVNSYRSAYAGILPQHYLDRFTIEEQTQDWQDLMVGDHEFTLLAAENDEGKVVGYALGHSGNVDMAGYDSELDALHVSSAEQHMGVGRALISAAARELHAAGAESLMLWVLVQNPARALYERLGGQPLGQRKITLGDGDVVAEEVAYGWKDIAELDQT